LETIFFLGSNFLQLCQIFIHRSAKNGTLQKTADLQQCNFEAVPKCMTTYLNNLIYILDIENKCVESFHSQRLARRAGIVSLQPKIFP
jgi:hypothetical protein